jgi:hypothetical protein
MDIQQTRVGNQIAGEDLTEGQFCFVKKDSSDGLIYYCGDGERALGILQNKPDEGQVCSIAVAGCSYLTMGATCSENAALASDADAAGTPAGNATTDISGNVSGDFVNAIALQACAAIGEQITVLVKSIGLIAAKDLS